MVTTQHINLIACERVNNSYITGKAWQLIHPSNLQLIEQRELHRYNEFEKVQKTQNCRFVCKHDEDNLLIPQLIMIHYGLSNPLAKLFLEEVFRLFALA